MTAVGQTIRRVLQSAGLLKGSRGGKPLEVTVAAGNSRDEPRVRSEVESRVAAAATPGRFVEHAYSGPAGSLAYKLYLPKGYGGKPLPLVVMLHGCSQNPDDFAAGTGMNRLADRLGFVVVYPAQSAAANGMRCWNWFNEKNQSRDSGEPALIAGITREVASTHDIDEDRIFVAGLSAGGAMAVILGATYPDLFAAVGVHSGLPYGAASSLSSSFAAMRGRGTSRSGPILGSLPTIVFHGDNDSTVNPSNGSAIVEQAVSQSAASRGPLKKTAQKRRTENGREISTTVYGRAKAQPVVEYWSVHGAGHAWSGGSSAGSFTDETGPDASAEMMRFFLAQTARR